MCHAHTSLTSHCLCREIIDEEMQVDQMSTRRYNSGMIQPDPEAPPKPDRDRHAAATPPMARVGSGNAVGGGRMYGGGLHSNDPQLSMHAAMEMDRRREVCVCVWGGGGGTASCVSN